MATGLHANEIFFSMYTRIIACVHFLHFSQGLDLADASENVSLIVYTYRYSVGVVSSNHQLP